MMTTYPAHPIRQGIDGIALVAFLLMIFGGLMVYRDINSSGKGLSTGGEVEEVILSADAESAGSEVGSGQDVPPLPNIDLRISPPYSQFTLTQGPHGYSYGHMAIDITAGKNAVIKSPIQGYVADLYTDQYGNPTLVLENDFYQVTLLHGKYKVAVGDQISWGQMVGREGNLGLTTDMQGRSCRNRDCGYHTHLNIFDKRLGVNVNPIEVMAQ
jgi:murein DD-endopeptidase MepM/ murein hydrolase activator NlpD